jgi:hypothetical protein
MKNKKVQNLKFTHSWAHFMSKSVSYIIAMHFSGFITKQTIKIRGKIKALCVQITETSKFGP